jgi:hypothetical protein
MRRVAFYLGFVGGITLVVVLVIASWYAPRCSRLLAVDGQHRIAVFVDECRGWVYYQTLPPPPAPQGDVMPL